MLAAAAFAIVLVTNDNPTDTAITVGLGNLRHLAELAGVQVLNVVGLAVLSVDGTDEHVVADVLQVATVLQPRSSHGDVVSGALALGLDEDLE